MGLGPTAVIGYQDENGNWVPVTTEKGLPVSGGGGGGGGAVSSVNGRTGEVVLGPEDITVTSEFEGELNLQRWANRVDDIFVSSTLFAVQMAWFIYGQWELPTLGPIEEAYGLIKLLNSGFDEENFPILFVGGTAEDLPEFFNPDMHAHISQDMLNSTARIDDLEARIAALEA